MPMILEDLIPTRAEPREIIERPNTMTSFAVGSARKAQ